MSCAQDMIGHTFIKKSIKIYSNLYAIKTIYVKYTEHEIESNEVVCVQQFHNQFMIRR